jgi:hypothetical protein
MRCASRTAGCHGSADAAAIAVCVQAGGDVGFPIGVGVECLVDVDDVVPVDASVTARYAEDAVARAEASVGDLEVEAPQQWRPVTTPP